MTIDDIGQKVENGGVSASGKLSAEEFNTLLAAVKSNRQQLGDLPTKFGHAEYVNGAINFYDEEGGTQLCSLQLVGDSYVVSVETSVESIFSVLTGDVSTPITISAETTKYESVGDEGSAFPENYTYSVAVDTGTGYVNKIANQALAEGGESTFDARSWLVTGANRIRVSVTGSTSGATKTIVLTANLTNLTLTVAHRWQTPWVEGSGYTLNGIRFAGNLAKTLKIKVADAEPIALNFAANQNYTTTAYSYTIDASMFPASSASGVYQIEIWLEGGGVSTAHKTYNIICLVENDTAPMVCVNEVSAAAVNYMSDKLFAFAVVNADSVMIQPTVTLDGTHVLQALTMSVAEGETYDYAPALEVEIVSETIIGQLQASITPYDMGQSGVTETVTMPFDNSLAFNATAGAVFYLNAAQRSNSEIDKDVVKNAAANAVTPEYAAEWTGFGWASDGWTQDEYGHQALVVPARSTVVVPQLKPLETIDNNGRTVEMLVRAANIGDESEPILTMLTQVGSDYEGFILYPTKVLVLATGAIERTLQGVGLCENVITHICVTIQKNYMDETVGRHLCSIYINGIPNVSFDFSGTAAFGNGPLTVGQPNTDTYLYMMRVYNFALEGEAVFNNFLNAVFEGTQTNRGEYARSEVREANDILDGTSIDYNYAAARGYNCMVIEPDDPDAPIPDFYHKYKDSSMPCSMRFQYGQHHEWDVMITNVPLDGQGTTSKKYFRWNLRGKLKKCNWYYTDGEGTRRGNYSETPTFTDSKKGYMDGGASGAAHSMIDRFTAKKNIASSQQGHKMGATALYDDLFTELGLKAELPSSKFRVAVWQYPFLGFVKRGDSYEFIGLYTAGPDKGCKTSFGYKDDYPVAMCIEGPNHNPRGTRFLHPWVDVTYSASEETLQFGGEEGWDDDYSSVGSSDEPDDAAAILACYESEWKPAYDLVYFCSPFIAKLTEANIGGTPVASGDSAAVTAINGNLTNFMKGFGTYVNDAGESVTRSNGLMSFYDSNYDIWYYRNSTGQYEKLAGHNIRTYLGLTGSPTTAQIIAARKAKFKAEMTDYFSLQQTLFHKCYCLLIGAKDNDAKNSYPFKHLALSEGGRWGWKQDDLDSIFDTDNNGQATVKYSVEYGDLNDGVQIFQGSDSAFWTMIWEWYPSELASMMGSIASALRTIAERMNIAGAALHESVYNVLAHYFFGQSALYFPIKAYQFDRTYGYLDAWFLGGRTVDGITYDTTYNGVAPLTQAQGDRYLDERLWIERRIAYLFSKYSLGGFSEAADGYGTASFTLAEGFTLHLTPAIDLYPTANTGGSGLVRAPRTAALQAVALTLPTGGATNNYINGTDWLYSLGDLCGMRLTSRGGSSVISFEVSSARMHDLKVGDAVASNVLFNATNLNVAGASLVEIDARNTSSITAPVDLTGCPRLQRALFEGSNARGIELAAGSRVEEVSFPNFQPTLFLHSLNFLDEEHMTIPSAMYHTVQNYYFNCCDELNPVGILAGIIGTVGNVLKYVTMIWNGTLEVDSAGVAALVALASGTDTETPANGYGRVTYQNGQASTDATHIPLVQGTIHCDLTQQQYDLLRATFPDLTITYDKLYLEFEDSRVLEICAYNWGDVVDKRGSVIASGAVEGAGNTQVFSDYVFASGLAIPAHGGASQIAARTVAYRIELEVTGSTGEPWDLDSATAGTADTVIFGVQQFGNNTSSVTTTHCSIASDGSTGWGSQSVLTKQGNKWVAEFTATTAAQYLRVAIRAAAGVTVRWSLTPLASGNACWQPVGITQAQCAAVSSLGTAFSQNKLVTAFPELVFFHVTTFNNLEFNICSNLSKIRLPQGTKTVGSSFNQCDNIGTWNFYPDSLTTCAYCANMYIDTMIVPPSVTSVASRAWSGSSYKRVYMRWLVFEGTTPPSFAGNPFYVDYGRIKIFVPDDSVEAYKAVSQLSSVKSRIYPISEFEDYFPGESHIRKP